MVLIGSLILLSSCVSRLVRPALSGTIVDFNGNPIDSCFIGETVTDSTGNFYLKEKRKNMFLLTEIFILEAPPIFVSEQISKPKYTTKLFQRFNKYGGGGPKGSHWKLDTLYLKKEDYKVDSLFLKHEWQVSATQNLDTLYFMKSEINQLCKTQRCSLMFQKYSALTNDSYYNRTINLPDSIIQKTIALKLSDGNLLKTTKVIEYGDKTRKGTILKANDTLSTKGYWKFEDDLLHLKSSFNELQGRYLIKENDYEFLFLVKAEN